MAVMTHCKRGHERTPETVYYPPHGNSQCKPCRLLTKNKYRTTAKGKRGLPVNSIRKAYAIGIPASVLLADDIDRQLTSEKG